MTDETAEWRTNAEVLADMGTDAAKWTDEFMRVQADPKSGDLDWGAMVGWFANAIEAGRSAGRREVCPHIETNSYGTEWEPIILCLTCGAEIEPESLPPRRMRVMVTDDRVVIEGFVIPVDGIGVDAGDRRVTIRNCVITDADA